MDKGFFQLLILIPTLVLAQNEVSTKKNPIAYEYVDQDSTQGSGDTFFIWDSLAGRHGDYVMTYEQTQDLLCKIDTVESGVKISAQSQISELYNAAESEVFIDITRRLKNITECQLSNVTEFSKAIENNSDNQLVKKFNNKLDENFGLLSQSQAEIRQLQDERRRLTGGIRNASTAGNNFDGPIAKSINKKIAELEAVQSLLINEFPFGGQSDVQSKMQESLRRGATAAQFRNSYHQGVKNYQVKLQSSANRLDWALSAPGTSDPKRSKEIGPAGITNKFKQELLNGRMNVVDDYFKSLNLAPKDVGAFRKHIENNHIKGPAAESFMLTAAEIGGVIGVTMAFPPGGIAGAVATAGTASRSAGITTRLLSLGRALQNSAGTALSVLAVAPQTYATCNQPDSPAFMALASFDPKQQCSAEQATQFTEAENYYNECLTNVVLAGTEIMTGMGIGGQLKKLIQGRKARTPIAEVTDATDNVILVVGKKAGRRKLDAASELKSRTPRNASASRAQSGQEIPRSWKKLDEESSDFRKRLIEYDPTTDDERLEMIRFVNSPNARGSQILDVENSVLKNLNEDLGDQDLVTALTNQHKEILSANMQDFAKKYADILDLKYYSDFKSQRFALVPANARVRATGIPDSVIKELDDLFATSNKEFAEKIRSLNIESKVDPENWFRAGLSKNADEANLNARLAREQKNGTNTIVHSESDEIDFLRRQSFAQLEKTRYQLTKKLPDSTPLLSGQGSSRVPTAEVFDIVKKSKGDLSLIQKSISYSFPGTKIDDDITRELIRYADEVDQFQPGIWQTSRESVSVAKAKNGAIKIDVGGLGSQNARETALQAAKCSVAGQVSKCTRFGEGVVTREFRKNLDSIREVSLNNCRRSGLDCDIQISGDDIVIIPKAGRLPDNFAANNIKDINRSVGEGRVRQAEIPAGIKSPEARQRLTNDGERFEKLLRTRLRTSPLADRTRNMTFTVKMDSKKAGSGRVNVQFEGSGGEKLSAEENSLLLKAYTEALSELNKKSNAKYQL